MIGLDGATLDLVLPWVQEGKLPGFAKLINEASYGALESTPNQRSASAWTSLMTGKNPGKHGIYEFYEYIPGTYNIRFVNASHRDAESLWSLLSRHEKKVIVVNVPMTYPAEEVNGILIAGLDAPGPKSEMFTYPQSFLGELQKRFGDYLLEPGITGFMVGGQIDDALENLYRELDQKMKVADYLMDSFPWDFFMVVFRSLDAVQHCFWKFMDPLHPEFTEEGNKQYGKVIYDVYKTVDHFIEKMLQKINDDVTLMLVSDHGFGKKHSATSQLNQWLERKGYLTLQHHKSDISKNHRHRFHMRMLAGLYKIVAGRTSRRLKETLVKFFPRLRDKIQSRLIFSGIDWNKTKAYTDSLFPNILINLKEREPMGIVEKEEYEELLGKIKADLETCRDSMTGERIVEKVFSKEEIYWGKHIDKAPDLLIRWREDIPIHGIKIDESDDLNKGKSPSYPLIPGEDPRIISGDHRLNGIFFMRGSNIRQNQKLTHSKIYDIVPTILYQLDCPIPEDVDGQVLREAFIKSYLDKNQPKNERKASGGEDQSKQVFRYSEEDSEKIAARLRDLGYLE